MLNLGNKVKSILISSPYQIIMAFAALLVSAHLGAATPSWDWTRSPSTSNWKTFFKLSDIDKGQEWKKATAGGLEFEAMAWEWKLAWVRSCTFSSTQDCSRIVQLGLFDRALVVRAESATRLGQRFEGTGYLPAIRLLRTAYSIQQNTRDKEPLFVQYRILQSLNKIGGEGQEVGKQLAMNSSNLHKYWTRIASAK